MNSNKCFERFIFSISFLIILVIISSNDCRLENLNIENIVKERVLLVPESFKTIQEAIDSAETGDIISIARGIYYENIEFSYKTVSLISRSEPEFTIIDGGQKGPVFFLYVSTDDGMTMKLQGITFRNGYASWPCAAISILYSHGIALTIDNCIIENNVIEPDYTPPYPSVLWYTPNWPQKILFSNTIIRNNTGGDDLIRIGDGNTITMENCEIYENQGNLFYNYYYPFPVSYFKNCIIRDNEGAAITSVNAKKVENCQIINNWGSGVADTVINCLISDNSGTGFGGNYVRNCVIKNNPGGGISTGNIKDSIIIGNSGVGVCLMGIMENCIVANNTSIYQVGGVFVWTGSKIVNCMIASNISNYSGSLRHAGGILVSNFRDYEDTTRIFHCTIVGNESKGHGAGVTFDWAAYERGTLELTNCIIANNKGGYGLSIGFQDSFDGFCINTYNDLWNNELGNYDPWGPGPGMGEFSLNPLFVGGKHHDLHLRGSSPCIDRGIDVGVYVDIEGDRRPFGSGFDMGADEWTGAGARR